MAAELHVVENPTVQVVPAPNRGGRYRLEFRPAPGKPILGNPAAGRPGCGHHSPHALLWLIFLESGREAGREVTDVICSRCDPARFARAQAWADALR